MHLNQTMHARRRFFAEAFDSLQQFREFLMNHRGQIATVIENHVQGLTVREENRLFDTPVEFFVGHPLPRVNGNACCGNRCCGMILRREDIAAAPGHFGAESRQGLDQNCCLDRHMKTPGDPCTGEWLRLSVFFTKCHQSGHFVFGDFDFLTTECCLADILNFVRNMTGRSGF